MAGVLSTAANAADWTLWGEESNALLLVAAGEQQEIQTDAPM